MEHLPCKPASIDASRKDKRVFCQVFQLHCSLNEKEKKKKRKIYLVISCIELLEMVILSMKMPWDIFELYLAPVQKGIEKIVRAINVSAEVNRVRGNWNLQITPKNSLHSLTLKESRQLCCLQDRYLLEDLKVKLTKY